METFVEDTRILSFCNYVKVRFHFTSIWIGLDRKY